MNKTYKKRKMYLISNREVLRKKNKVSLHLCDPNNETGGPKALI